VRLRGRSANPIPAAAMVPYAHSHHYRRRRSSCRRPECRTGTPPRAGAPRRQITLLLILLDSGCGSVQGRLLRGQNSAFGDVRACTTTSPWISRSQIFVYSRMWRRLCTMSSSMPVSSDYLPPSSFISCSRSGPSDACLTSAARCAFTQVGGDYVLASSSDGTHCRGHRLLNTFGYR